MLRRREVCVSSPASVHQAARKGLVERSVRFLADLKWGLTPGRRMSEAERRELHRLPAKDPAVERAVQDLLRERPWLRRNGTE